MYTAFSMIHQGYGSELFLSPQPPPTFFPNVMVFTSKSALTLSFTFLKYVQPQDSAYNQFFNLLRAPPPPPPPNIKFLSYRVFLYWDGKQKCVTSTFVHHRCIQDFDHIMWINPGIIICFEGERFLVIVIRSKE